jgi:hypothetical protein
MIDEILVTPRRGPFNIELTGSEQKVLRQSVPNGIEKRIANNAVVSKDIIWFHNVVSKATTLNPPDFTNREILYIVESVGFYIEGKEPRSFEEFIGENESFINKGGLGIYND